MKAVLFDLDGTLLQNNFDVLLNHYFQGISQQFTQWMEPQHFVKQLMASTYVMIGNKDPDKLNLEVFSEDFFGKTGLDPELMRVFDRFYVEEFPKLRGLAQGHQDANRVIEAAFANNYKVVIATNPVFPTIAIEERLRWANVANYSYDLVTTGDNMHFCKPHPEYYQEIAHMIGVDPKDCLMVGDDPENDGPAEKIGMHTFLLVNGNTLGDVLHILEQ